MKGSMEQALTRWAQSSTPRRRRRRRAAGARAADAAEPSAGEAGPKKAEKKADVVDADFEVVDDDKKK
jgi:molecular chaperone DnaK